MGPSTLSHTFHMGPWVVTFGLEKHETSLIQGPVQVRLALVSESAHLLSIVSLYASSLETVDALLMR